MSETRRRKPTQRRGSGSAPARDFWGSVPEEDDIDLIRPADDPSAMVRSLGRPPLPGWETAADVYFTAVYDRAAALAGALAAASDLLDTDDE